MPAFQDTYGWLVFRRGEAEEALPYLESAAAELSQDPIVQFHLGQTYAALERDEDAIAQYRRVLEFAGEDDPRPQIAIAREPAGLDRRGTLFGRRRDAPERRARQKKKTRKNIHNGPKFKPNLLNTLFSIIFHIQKMNMKNN